VTKAVFLIWSGTSFEVQTGLGRKNWFRRLPSNPT
jgi:hypothetical protein